MDNEVRVSSETSNASLLVFSVTMLGVGHGSVVGSFDVRPFSLMGWAGPARFCPTGYFEDFNVIYRLLKQHL